MSYCKYSKRPKLISTKKPKELKITIKTPADVILYGLKSEKSTVAIEAINTLVFICAKNATKKEIKDAFEAIYNVKAKKVNTLNTIDGKKKAYIRCLKDGDAIEVANDAQIL
ncbi:60S ribosomal protein L23A [Cucumispora dikerogammari]|nr:60S ribosomal protein L23A [Cucumispora dikerogammari]